MSRYIEVKACGSCPHAIPSNATIAACRKADRSIPDFASIPEWCPLPVLPVMVDVCDELLRREEERR